MIYEENDLMRALLQEWLSEAGYIVQAAPSDEPGSGGSAHLIIVSVYMPKRAGAQHVREIQTIHPGTPVIAISGQFFAGLRGNGAIAQSLGVQQAIAKPLNRLDLLAAVRTLVGAPD